MFSMVWCYFHVLIWSVWTSPFKDWEYYKLLGRTFAYYHALQQKFSGDGL